MLLDPGMDLTLRPMRYPLFYKMYQDAIKNTWTVEEVDFSIDVNDLRRKMTDADRHLIHRLVAFFATGDSTATCKFTCFPILSIILKCHSKFCITIPRSTWCNRSSICLRSLRLDQFKALFITAYLIEVFLSSSIPISG